MNELTELRTALQLNKKDFAKLLQVPYGTLVKWENGEREPPHIALTAFQMLRFIVANNLLESYSNYNTETIKQKAKRITDEIMVANAQYSDLDDIRSKFIYLTLQIFCLWFLPSYPIKV